MHTLKYITLVLLPLVCSFTARGTETDSLPALTTTAVATMPGDSIADSASQYTLVSTDVTTVLTEQLQIPASLQIDTTYYGLMEMANKHKPINIYQLPYSLKGSSPNWHNMWINTAVLSGAFVSTLLVLECLPEDATTWNRAALQRTPPLKRWFRNVFKRGPEWDHDNAIFNYVLHPYAGAAYFMSARSQGFNFYQSLLYSACISTIGWEFGIEACMERPSYQDIFITPLVGSLIGEGFYRIKRHIVSHDYRLAGSPVLGNIVVFLVDPVNEVIGLFRGNDARKLHQGRYTDRGITSSLMPGPVGNGFGFTFSCTF